MMLSRVKNRSPAARRPDHAGRCATQCLHRVKTHTRRKVPSITAARIRQPESVGTYVHQILLRSPALRISEGAQPDACVSVRSFRGTGPTEGDGRSGGIRPRSPTIAGGHLGCRLLTWEACSSPRLEAEKT